MRERLPNRMVDEMGGVISADGNEGSGSTRSGLVDHISMSTDMVCKTPKVEKETISFVATDDRDTMSVSPTDEMDTLPPSIICGRRSQL